MTLKEILSDKKNLVIIGIGAAFLIGVLILKKGKLAEGIKIEPPKLD